MCPYRRAHTSKEISTPVVGFKNGNHVLDAARRLQLCVDGFDSLPWLLGREGPEELSDGADRRPDDRRCAVVAASRRAGAAPDAEEEAMVLQEDGEGKGGYNQE